MVINASDRYVLAVFFVIMFQNERKTRKETRQFVKVTFTGVFGKNSYGDVLLEQTYTLFHCFNKAYIRISR